MPDVFPFVSQEDGIQSVFALSAILLFSVHCLLHCTGKVVVPHWILLSKQIMGRSDSALDSPEFRIKFNNQLDELRVSILVGARMCALVLCPIICCAHLLIRQAAPLDTCDVFRAPVAVLGLYFMSLVAAIVNPSPSAADGHKLYAVVTLLLSVWVCCMSAEHLSTFFSSANRQIMLVQLVLALPVLDAPLVMCWNPVLSLATCCTYARYLDSMSSEGQRGDYSAHFAHFAIFELCTLIVFGIFLCGFESIVRSSVRSSVQSETRERAYQAGERMLSVLCDAQVHLSANLSVLVHSPSLPSLLRASPGAGPGSLHGSPFVEHIAEVDRGRFYQFLSHVKCLEGQNQSTCEHSLMEPPASICLSLKLNGGGTVPVEFYSVRLADDTDEPGHLIGIKAGSFGDVPDATGESAQPLRRAKLDEDTMLSVSETSSISEEPSVRESSQPSSGEAAGRDQVQVEYDRLSSSSRFSAAGHLVHSVGMRVDVLSDSFNIWEITLQLAQETSSTDSDGTSTPAPPGLLDWLPSSQAGDTIVWLQQVVNAMMSGHNEATGHGPLQLVRGQDVFLAAERVEAQSLDSFTNGSIMLNLRLRGISSFKFVWPLLPKSETSTCGSWIRSGGRRRKSSAGRGLREGLGAITESIAEEARRRQVPREGEPEPPLREAGWPQQLTGSPSSAPS